MPVNELHDTPTRRADAFARPGELRGTTALSGSPAAKGVTAVLEKTLTRTVPREYVHRSAVAEVLLTGWRTQDEGHFVLQAQWPRCHTFYDADSVGGHDPLLIAETIRQSGLLVAHAELGVPMGHQFLMHDLSFTARPDRMLVGGAPTDLTVEFRCAEVKRRRTALSWMRYETVLRRNGETIATGGASFTCVTAQVYRRMRGDRMNARALPLPRPVEPAGVGRQSALDVVLSPAGAYGRWQLRVDVRHPVLFDHPIDHIPGMVLMEAARQATVAVLDRPAPVVLAIAGTYDRFAELDLPCVIEAYPPPGTSGRAGGTVRVTGSQDGRPVFSAQVTV
ncbi:ScbA/BarX family gamma-butyrolactone biosynthesis protein [Actinacidiphila acididurans]|uniref:A-factor biosynthesis hotdog domain-containing protein n=1 Tax=Actinacidiphila acididurans TaxID=2784346 RepID=A0ABS2TVB1_9ACTN|nr:ScbA/BarX family gamma-butyrolactone biosynthesis protein [Actinacidiphila acididurans]MBM9507276.1 hypothetical protein [Actinacidiphila acididurans]